MEIEGDKRYTTIVDKQFEMLGLQIRFKDIPEDGVVTVGKKKDYWYNVYKFTTEQEEEWKEWARKECEKFGTDGQAVFEYLDLRYGFVHTYRKAGELF